MNENPSKPAKRFRTRCFESSIAKQTTYCTMVLGHKATWCRVHGALGCVRNPVFEAPARQDAHRLRAESQAVLVGRAPSSDRSETSFAKKPVF